MSTIINDIQFFIFKSQTKVVPKFYQTEFDGDLSSLYRPAYESLEKQLHDLNVSGHIQIIDQQDTPSNVKSFLVCFLTENSLVPDDYVARILAMNNLHRNMAMVCGPVFTIAPTAPKDIIEKRIARLYKYYKYDDFSHFISCKLNKDENNYPPIYGCIFSGRHYNECNGYNPIISPRGILDNNYHFIKQISTTGPIIYTERLTTGYFITSEELSPDNYSTHFYNRGYYDAHKGKSVCSELLEIEHQVEESHDLIELCKCMYNLGYYEGKTKCRIVV